MRLEPSRVCLLAFISVPALLGGSPAIAAAQRQQAPPAVVERQLHQIGGQPAPAVSDGQNANDKRDTLRQILEKYPPAVGEVLKLDPSLLNDADYLATYPELAAYIGQHPEVAHDPDFFLANVRAARMSDPVERRAQSLRMLDEILGGLAALTVFAIVVATLIWLIRTIIDYRRWNRLSKVQTDVHTKLLDRFTANDELLAYIQTPAGRKFLESAPIPLQEEARSMGAPLSRILWSVQAGVVLTLLGFGLLFVSGRTIEEVAQGMFVFGVLVVALGLGFVISAVVAWAISRRMGLLERPVQEHA